MIKELHSLMIGSLDSNVKLAVYTGCNPTVIAQLRACVEASLPALYTALHILPIRVRGSGQKFNGKYHCKVLKFQLVSTVLGEPLALYHVLDQANEITCRTFDSVVYKTAGTGIELHPNEIVIGDKGYQGCPGVLTPIKCRRSGPISDGEAKFNKLLQLVRSPAERIHARLHAWAVMRFSPYRDALTESCVKAVVALEGPFARNQNCTEWTRPREEPLPLAPCSVAAVKLATVEWAATTTLNLRGRNSSHAAHSAPKRKLLRLEHETRCKKCKEERSCCTCPPPNTRGRGRGRGRGPQYKNSSSSGSTESSCSGSTESSSDDNSSDSTTECSYKK